MASLIKQLFQNKEALIIVISVIGVTLLNWLYSFWLSRKYHLKELKALGFYQDNTREYKNEKTGLREHKVSSKIKVYWKRNKLIFAKYNRSYGVDDFEKLRSKLQTLFGKKIELITHERQWFSSQPRIILHTEVFPEKYMISQRPKLNVGQIFLGMDALARTVILEAIKNFENTLLILAPKGSGKSVLINGIISTFFETLKENQKIHDYQLIVCDNKGTG